MKLLTKSDKFIYGLAINIIVMFGIWFIWSFAGDYMRDTDWFGDVYLKEASYDLFGKSNWDWGIRHHLWNWCWFIVALLMVARLFMNLISVLGGGTIFPTKED